MLAVGKTIKEVFEKLQRATDNINEWTTTWQIKPNETQWVDNNTKKDNYLLVRIYNRSIPHSNTAKHFGININKI